MKKRIGILTFFESDNYGTVLQAYALQKYCEDAGYEAELVQIARNVTAVSRRAAAEPERISLYRRCLAKGVSLLHANDRERKKEAFCSFRFRYLHLASRKYENDRDLLADPPDYDIYMSGGDQIWNPYHKIFSYHYMWDFLPDGKKLLSYGSSFGVGKIADPGILADMGKALSRFSGIGIREQSGVDILRQMRLSATQVLDPVFLIRDTWRDMAAAQPARKRGYVLVYALIDYPASEDAGIRAYARRHHLDIVILPDNARNRANTYTKAFDLSPESFLSYLANAEAVFTNSFHGLAFSILFRRRFTLLGAVSPEGQEKRIRLTDMLHTLGIGDRGMTDCEKEIDYAAVDCRIDELTRGSRGYLDRALEEAVKEP